MVIMLFVQRYRSCSHRLWLIKVVVCLFVTQHRSYGATDTPTRGRKRLESYVKCSGDASDCTRCERHSVSNAAVDDIENLADSLAACNGEASQASPLLACAGDSGTSQCMLSGMCSTMCTCVCMSMYVCCVHCLDSYLYSAISYSHVRPVAFIFVLA